MGQELSKEAQIIKGLKESLRGRGIRVQKKNSVKFFLYIHEKCPWFIIAGPHISPQKWQKVGCDLNVIP